MKASRIAAMVKKDLKSFVREPATIFMLLLFPLVVTMTFGVAFGGIGTENNTQFKVGVVNMDANSTDHVWSDWFVGNLTKYNGTTVISYATNETGQSDLLNGNLHALILIPKGFGDSIVSYWSSPVDGKDWENTTVELYLDSGSMMASSAIPPMVQQVLYTTIYGNQVGSMQLPVEIGSPSMVYVSDLSQWDFMAPGIFAFAAIFMIMTVAQSLTVERDGGILARMATTPVTSSEFILSRALSYVLVGIAQVSIVFGASFAIGYRPNTDAYGLAFAFLIVLVFCLTSVGMGLFTAVISKSTDVAAGVSFIFIMPQMFFGTFMPLGGITETLGAFMPSSYVTHALTTLFLRGAPIGTLSIWIDLLVVSVVSITMLSLGALLFRKRTAKH